MKALSIRELKNNPSAALRDAQTDDLVVVMNRQQPQALLVDLAHLGSADLAGVKFAFAVALFRQGQVSLGYAARVAGLSVSALIERFGRMGIPIVNVDDRELEHDLSAIAHGNAPRPPDHCRCRAADYPVPSPELGLLQQVFGQVCITDAVRDELLGGGTFPGQAGIEAALADWIDVVPVGIGTWKPANPDWAPARFRVSSWRCTTRAVC